MKITSLVENTSATGLPTEHGLSLYIQMDCGKKILFDMGQRRLFADNAERLGLDIADVDIAVISHGHYDHGGGLRTFLGLNGKAQVYIHKDAFQPHYSLRDTGLAYIGLDKDIMSSKRLVFCDNLNKIGENLTLFADVHGDCCCPNGNRLLYGPSETVRDDFCHEQNLIIEEGDNVVLFAGCAHNGIVNIIRKAEHVLGLSATPFSHQSPTHVLAGMHLVKSGLGEAEEETFINNLAKELMEYADCRYYTMHCTGTEQFEKLKSIMNTRNPQATYDQIEYLSCGDSVCI